MQNNEYQSNSAQWNALGDILDNKTITPVTTKHIHPMLFFIKEYTTNVLNQLIKIINLKKVTTSNKEQLNLVWQNLLSAKNIQTAFEQLEVTKEDEARIEKTLNSPNQPTKKRKKQNIPNSRPKKINKQSAWNELQSILATLETNQIKTKHIYDDNLLQNALGAWTLNTQQIDCKQCNLLIKSISHLLQTRRLTISNGNKLSLLKIWFSYFCSEKNTENTEEDQNNFMPYYINLGFEQLNLTANTRAITAQFIAPLITTACEYELSNSQINQIIQLYTSNYIPYKNLNNLWLQTIYHKIVPSHYQLLPAQTQIKIKQIHKKITAQILSSTNIIKITDALSRNHTKQSTYEQPYHAPRKTYATNLTEQKNNPTSLAVVTLDPDDLKSYPAAGDLSQADRSRAILRGASTHNTTTLPEEWLLCLQQITQGNITEALKQYNNITGDFKTTIETVFSIKYITNLIRLSCASKHLPISLNRHSDVICTNNSVRLLLTQSYQIWQWCNNKQSSDMLQVGLPGHHFYPNNPRGFCLYNSAAFAAFACRNNTLIVSTDINPDDGTKKSLKRLSQRINGSITHLDINDPQAWPQKHMRNQTQSNYEYKSILLTEGNQNSPAAVMQSTTDQIQSWAAIQQTNATIIVSLGWDSHIDDNSWPSTARFNSMQMQIFYSCLKTISEENSNIKILYTIEGGYNIDVLKNETQALITTYRTKQFTQTPTHEITATHYNAQPSSLRM